MDPHTGVKRKGDQQREAKDTRRLEGPREKQTGGVGPKRERATGEPIEQAQKRSLTRAHGTCPVVVDLTCIEAELFPAMHDSVGVDDDIDDGDMVDTKMFCDEESSVVLGKRVFHVFENSQLRADESEAEVSRQTAVPPSLQHIIPKPPTRHGEI